MASCAKPDASGYLQLTTDAPQSCTGYLVVTPDEYQSLAASPWVPLTMEEGVIISTAILALWALAFVFRALRAQLQSSQHSGE